MESLVPPAICHHGRIRVATERAMEFVDLTAPIEALATQARIRAGIVNIHSQHAATAIVLAEHEPLLLSDFDALLPGSSMSLNLANGYLQLGRRQRVFLVDLDGPRVCEVSVLVLDNQEPSVIRT